MSFNYVRQVNYRLNVLHDEFVPSVGVTSSHADTQLPIDFQALTKFNPLFASRLRKLQGFRKRFTTYR